MAASTPGSGPLSSGVLDAAAVADGGLAEGLASIGPDGHVARALEGGFLLHSGGPSAARSAGSLLAAEVALVERAGGLGAEVFCPTVTVDPTAAALVVPDERDDWAMMPDGIPGATIPPDAI